MYINVYILCSKTVDEFSLCGLYVGILGYVVGKVVYIIHMNKLHTEENGHKLDLRVIGVWKYVRTGINAYLKNQAENHSKIDNTVNNQKFKTS